MSVRVIAEIVFWSSVVALIYTYAGYPALIALLSTLRPRRIKCADYTPAISVIITAYNEERALPASIGRPYQ